MLAGFAFFTSVVCSTLNFTHWDVLPICWIKILFGFSQYCKERYFGLLFWSNISFIHSICTATTNFKQISGTHHEYWGFQVSLLTELSHFIHLVLHRYSRIGWVIWEKLYLTSYFWKDRHFKLGVNLFYPASPVHIPMWQNYELSSSVKSYSLFWGRRWDSSL